MKKFHSVLNCLLVLCFCICTCLCFCAGSPAGEQPKLDLTRQSVAGLLDDARAKAAASKFEEAEVSLRKALKLSPDDPLVFEACGRTFYELGKADELTALMERACRRHPHNMKLLSLLVSWKEHPMEERLANALIVLKHRPMDVEMYRIAFDCYEVFEQIDAAALILKAMESKGFTDSGYYLRKAKLANHQGHYLAASEYASKSFSLSSSDKHKALKERAYANYKLKHFADCLKDLNLIISETNEVNGELMQALRSRGKVYFELKDYPRAIRDFSAVISDADFPEPDYVRRAEVYIACNKLQEAHDDLQSAIRLETMNGKAHKLLSEVLARQGKIEASEKEASIARKYLK